MSADPRYSGEVERLFRETPGAGRPAGAGWVSAEAREPLTATHVRWHLRVGAGGGLEARYEVRGCPHTVAAAALIAADLAGQPARAAAAVDPGAIAARLGAPATKLGRFFVIQDAIRQAALLLGAGSA